MNHRFKTYLKAVLFFTFSSVVMAGQLDLGAQYVGWNSNYVQPFNGWELWAPLSLSFKLDPGIGIYAQTEYGLGNYADSFGGNTETIQLNNFSDSVIGTEISFKSFSVPSILNIGINLPTGDQTWETKQIASSIPTDFINSRYRGGNGCTVQRTRRIGSGLRRRISQAGPCRRQKVFGRSCSFVPSRGFARRAGFSRRNGLPRSRNGCRRWPSRKDPLLPHPERG